MVWLNDPDALLAEHDRLAAIADELDDDENVPERYTSTLAGRLSQADSQRLHEASAVLHHLYLEARFPSQHADSYVRRGAVPAADAASN